MKKNFKRLMEREREGLWDTYQETYLTLVRSLTRMIKNEKNDLEKNKLESMLLRVINSYRKAKERKEITDNINLAEKIFL